ncbi:hypothetical protein MRS76_01915 [Rhizobiaceae bacterium n13]|uniref:Phage holin family protein n=1 Tax=Ferirhizobium litorale TaxID=2927786 RepID=A0AAE3U2C4_9HYPH|nr:hypothetical protein [Fererhizobium litorale]MDI7860701.1 hypothetical protein [Fererhizobium litorale]MDI7920849.1 hypothetical protein [Fererhizobium litorale]
MSLIVSLLSRALTLNVRDTMRRARRNGVLLAFAILMFLTTYGMLLVAALFWLTSIYGLMPAILFLAAATLLLGLIAVLIVYVANAKEQQRRLERQRRIEAAALPVISTGLSLIRSRPLMALGLAIAILTATSGSRHDEDEDD